MAFTVGQKLHAQDVACALARCHSTGVGLPSVASGATGVMVFDTVDNNGGSDITISGTNNSRMTFNVTAEYKYGFGVRFSHTSTPTGGDCFVFARLNGSTQLCGDVQKPQSVAAVAYIAGGKDTRLFQATDYLEICMLNNFGVTVAQTGNEVSRFFAKRTVGP